MWFQLLSHAKIPSYVELQVSWAAKMSDLHCQFDLGSTALHWIPEEEDSHLSSIWHTETSVIVVFWGIISDHRENGRDF